jgi:hypothetical protein
MFEKNNSIDFLKKIWKVLYQQLWPGLDEESKLSHWMAWGKQYFWQKEVQERLG